VRKRGMARDPLSWIGGTSETEERVEAREERGGDWGARRERGSGVMELGTSELPKFATLLPVTARLSEAQIEFLDTMERRIMRNRRRRKERITKNTLIRAAIELLMSLNWDFTDIADEEELIRRIRRAAGVL
jgi:hypothetical protein